ncbi:teichoic acids export ABC transporter ATP-binding subunit TagH [Bacillus nitroreducens]
MSSSVIFHKVTKRYKMYQKKSDKLLDIALPKDFGQDFYALQNVSFKAEKGDVIGVIGINGSGKSTLSNLIAGVIPPTSGEIEINGDVSIISIASGLNNQLTGRDNIELKCLMLGFSKQKIKELMPEIIEFAELGKFIDQPVKSYSSGMKARLGFSISVTIDPDILVVDEALSVGDKTFADKSLAKMIEFKERGKTIFFISHSISQVKQFCEKALWLEAGEIKAYGSSEEVIPQYEKFVNGFRKLSKEEQERIKKEFDDRRSKIRVAEEVEDDGDDDGSLPPPTIKRRSFKPKFWLIGFLFISLLTLGAVLSWDKFFTKPEPPKKVEPEVSVQNEEAKINTEKVEEEPEIIEQLDIRYVNVAAAYVRDLPNLTDSNQVSMVYFGQPILVTETKEDPNGELTWLKFNIQDNQEVWISDGVVEKFEKSVDEGEFIPAVDTQYNVDLSEVNVLFTTDEESLKEEDTTTYTFDEEGYLSEVSYRLNKTTSVEELTSNLGQPHLVNEDQNMVMYHGKDFDYVFYAEDSNQMNTLVVRPVIKDKEAIIELDLFEDDVETEDTETPSQTDNNSTSNTDQTREVTTTPTPPKKEEKPKAPTKPSQPKESEQQKEPSKPKDPKPNDPKPEDPKQPEQPVDPTPDPVVPPEDPEDPTPDPLTPSNP